MFDEELQLDDLDGDNGFVIEGIAAGDGLGGIVRNAGDINNDGFDDVVIGAPAAEGEGDDGDAGEAYVVFGSNDITGDDFDLDDLDGDNGFVINGIDEFDLAGFSVSSAGDLDSDGIDDLIIAAPGATVDGNVNAGEYYVIFGSSDFDSSLDLDDLGGNDGFTLEGFVAGGGGIVAAAGDLNGDNIDDIAIGSPLAPNDDEETAAGQVYIVFGQAGSRVGNFGFTFDLENIDSSEGFTINGVDAGDLLGFGVSAAGDVNGDGLDDLIVGAPGVDVDGDTNAGTAYVIFGRDSVGGGRNPNAPSTFETQLDPQDLDDGEGFAIEGLDDNVELGFVTSSGDFNGDNINDILVGVTSSSSITGNGTVFVVFGSTDLNSSDAFDLNDLDGSNGFSIENVDISFTPELLDAVSFVGDLNDDGFDDLGFGFPLDAPNSGADAGRTFVLFGTNDLVVDSDGVFDFGDFDAGDDGFFIEGLDGGDLLGASLSAAGDFNNDGTGDLIVAAPGGSPNGNTAAGESHLIFGTEGPNMPPVAADDPNFITAADTALAIDFSALLANDEDGDGDALTVTGVGAALEGGLVALSADNTITYDPNGIFDSLLVGQTGTDEFTYTVSDGNGGTDTATVTITITGANDAPAATDDTDVTSESAAIVVDVLANDADAEGDNFSINSFDTTGTIGLVTDNGDGTLGYNPNGQFESLASGAAATDSFTYTLVDANGAVSQAATVTITINGVNDAPVPTETSFTSFVSTTAAAGTEILTVTGSDIDVGDELLFAFAPGNAAALDLDNDGQPAVSIDEISGVLAVNDSDDLLQATGDLVAEVLISDAGEPALTAGEPVVITLIPATDFSGGIASEALAAAEELSTILGSNSSTDLLSSAYADFALSAGGSESLDRLAVASAASPADQAAAISALDLVVA